MLQSPQCLTHSLRSTSNSDLSTLVSVNSVETDGKIIEAHPDHNGQPSDLFQRQSSSKELHQVTSRITCLIRFSIKPESKKRILIVKFFLFIL